MTKFKLGSEINPNNLTPGTNKNKIKKEKEKKMNYFKESIKYFNKCKSINVSLGINQIKIIYSLIMISKCYIQLNDYKNAIIKLKKLCPYFLNFQNLSKITIQKIIILNLCFLLKIMFSNIFYLQYKEYAILLINHLLLIG